jgi:hypothetical protein
MNLLLTVYLLGVTVISKYAKERSSEVSEIEVADSRSGKKAYAYIPLGCALSLLAQITDTNHTVALAEYRDCTMCGLRTYE